MAQYKLIKLFNRDIYCLACIETGRYTQVEYIENRKALLELLPNTIIKPRDSKEWQRRQRPLRTYFGLLIGSLYTKGKHRIRTLSILTIKKRNYLYIREVSKIGKGGGYITEMGVVV